MQKHREKIELIKKTEISEIEHLHKVHKDNLKTGHEKVLTDAKDFFNEITKQSVDQLNSLQVRC